MGASLSGQTSGKPFSDPSEFTALRRHASPKSLCKPSHPRFEAMCGGHWRLIQRCCRQVKRCSVKRDHSQSAAQALLCVIEHMTKHAFRKQEQGPAPPHRTFTDTPVSSVCRSEPRCCPQKRAFRPFEAMRSSSRIQSLRRKTSRRSLHGTPCRNCHSCE